LLQRCSSGKVGALLCGKSGGLLSGQPGSLLGSKALRLRLGQCSSELCSSACTLLLCSPLGGGQRSGCCVLRCLALRLRQQNPVQRGGSLGSATAPARKI
jgi:hypothetical protein